MIYFLLFFVLLVYFKGVYEAIYHPFMSRKDKKAYLRSSEWGRRRKRILDRDNHQCKVCGASERLEVHHITYDRLGSEYDSDLVTLCRNCHQKVHNKYGYKRDTIYQINYLKK